jgi:hypothetical protein
VCGKYQNRWKEALSLSAAGATVMSAVVSLAVLGLAYIQLKQTGATLQLANAALQLANLAKSQAEASEGAVKDASVKLNDLVKGVEEQSRRMQRVEGVLTQVDLISGGRKLCLIYRPVTWNDEAGAIPLYVPATWTAGACKAQALKLGGAQFRLGCVFRDHASLGTLVENSRERPAVAPPENCGW